MKQCLVMQHVAFEDMGTFEPVLEDEGFSIRYCLIGDAPTEEEWLNADLAVVLGGPIGVYDQVLYPFLKDEQTFVRKRLDSGKPLLGICLGAQLIAAVLKARVYPGKGKEIGWGGIELTEAGRRSPLRFLDGYKPVLHWHGDIFDLPEGAELLASTPMTPHQASGSATMCWPYSFIPKPTPTGWKAGSSGMPVNWRTPPWTRAACVRKPDVSAPTPARPDKPCCGTGWLSGRRMNRSERDAQPRFGCASFLLWGAGRRRLLPFGHFQTGERFGTGVRSNIPYGLRCPASAAR